MSNNTLGLATRSRKLSLRGRKKAYSYARAGIALRKQGKDREEIVASVSETIRGDGEKVGMPVWLIELLIALAVRWITDWFMKNYFEVPEMPIWAFDSDDDEE